MANKRDYYEVLGVQKGASADAIKSAYRKAAKESHPDLHPNDKKAEERFKEVNEAYEVLSDDNKRARYDQFGHEDPMGGGAGGYGSGGFGGGFNGFGFDDIFDTIFGGSGGQRAARQNGPQRGADLRYDMTLTFEEAAFGAKKEFKFNRMENCDVCDGTGAKPGTQPQTCGACHGTGQVRTTMNTLFGQTVTQQPCPTCGGTGKIIPEKCTKCGGNGRVRVSRTAKIDVPAGIDNGQVITMSGQGEPGLRGGPAGDLYVAFTVKPHKIFKRDGFDLYCEIPISFTQAALGADIDVPTLEGVTRHHIADGTQNDAVIRLKGKGIQHLRGVGKGDLYVKIRVEIPKKLSDKQKDLLKQFEDSLTGKEYEGRKSFFERIKDNLR